jgi:hypothetical protein
LRYYRIHIENRGRTPAVDVRGWVADFRTQDDAVPNHFEPFALKWAGVKPGTFSTKTLLPGQKEFMDVFAHADQWSPPAGAAQPLLLSEVSWRFQPEWAESRGIKLDHPFEAQRIVVRVAALNASMHAIELVLPAAGQSPDPIQVVSRKLESRPQRVVDFLRTAWRRHK